MKRVVLLILLLTVAGCATAPTPQENDVGPRMLTREYNALVDKYTASTKKYDGFYNVLEAAATLLNTDVQTAVLQKTHETLQWDAATAQKEREKLFQENSNSTKVFLSFYTPSRRLNDLNKGNSVWKIYLESGGEKYEGRAMKRNMALEVLQQMFPYHSRWAIAYDVTFPVPVSAVEKSDAYLVITSTIATVRLKFPPVEGGTVL